MSTPHPLNHAVIAQALNDLRNGQLHRCKAMGFSDDALAALKHPAAVSVLLNAPVPWCSVTINREVLQRLLGQVQAIEQEIAAVDRMLRLDASTEMVSTFFGLTHQEVALRRDMLGLPKRKGRHPVLNEAQEAEAWQRWRQHGAAVGDSRAMLDLTLDLAEELSLPASVIWASIQGWIEQGLT